MLGSLTADDHQALAGDADWGAPSPQSAQERQQIAARL